MEELIKNIKLIVSEVDGILTDGYIARDALGNVPYKNFIDTEFEVINLIKRNFDIVFMSKDASVTYNLFRQKNIPFYWAKKEKMATLRHLMAKYQVTPEQVLYLGYGLSDVECLKMVPLSITFNKSSELVRSKAAFNITEVGSPLGTLYDEVLLPEITRRNLCL